MSSRIFPPRTMFEAIRREIDRHQPPAQKTSTAIDIPLSDEAKHVLAYAGEEAERLHHHFIGTEHLLLGILREEQSFACQLLQRHGLNISEVRGNIAENQPPTHGLNVQRTSVGTLGFFQLLLRVANLDASIDFYTKLGFTPVGQHGPGTAVLSNGNCVVKLDQNALADHVISFLSPDIIPVVSRLQAARLQIEQPPRTDADGSATAVLRDPDGNLISFVSPPR